MINHSLAASKQLQCASKSLPTWCSHDAQNKAQERRAQHEVWQHRTSGYSNLLQYVCKQCACLSA